MTLSELKNLLIGIPGYENKVVYYAWPENEAPALPFICYLETGSNGFQADGITFYSAKKIDIELYTDTRSPEEEEKVESALASASVPWEKTLEYIVEEKCWMINYSVEV